MVWVKIILQVKTHLLYYILYKKLKEKILPSNNGAMESLCNYASEDDSSPSPKRNTSVSRDFHF